MSYNGQNLDLTSFAGCSDDNDFVRGKSNTVDDFFDIFKSEDNTGLDLQNHQYAGPSKPLVPWYLLPSQANDQGPPCTGVEVSGGPGGLSHLSDPATAPVSLYSGDQVSLDEEQNSRRDAEWVLVSDPDPFGLFSLDLPPSHPIPGITPPVALSPASLSGPQRRSQRAKGKQSYNPVSSSRNKGGLDEGEKVDGWDVTLAHFRVELHKIVHNGQPAGGSPETALVAKITKLVKDDLKRSPLRDTKAGEGTRSRDVEEYLIGILRESLPAHIPHQSGSDDTTKATFFARLADTLEARLVAVNQQQTLRRVLTDPVSQIGKGARHEQTEDRVKKNRRERTKRGGERFHLGRIGHLFRMAGPYDTWTRVDVLSFAAAFLLYGPDAFSSGFVKVSFA